MVLEDRVVIKTCKGRNLKKMESQKCLKKLLNFFCKKLFSRRGKRAIYWVERKGNFTPHPIKNVVKLLMQH